MMCQVRGIGSFLICLGVTSSLFAQLSTPTAPASQPPATGPVSRLPADLVVPDPAPVTPDSQNQPVPETNPVSPSEPVSPAQPVTPSSRGNPNPAQGLQPRDIVGHDVPQVESVRLHSAAPDYGPTPLGQVGILESLLFGDNAAESKIKMNGWLETDYTYRSSGPGLTTVAPMMNRFGDEFLGRELGFVLSRPLDPNDWSWGFNVIYFGGADAAVINPSRGWVTNPDPRFEPGVYRPEPDGALVDLDRRRCGRQGRAADQRARPDGRASAGSGCLAHRTTAGSIWKRAGSPGHRPHGTSPSN